MSREKAAYFNPGTDEEYTNITRFDSYLSSVFMYNTYQLEKPLAINSVSTYYRSLEVGIFYVKITV